MSRRLSENLFFGACLVLAAACSGGASDGPPSGILITLDTTNADALGAFGGRAGVTPHLDQLAAESVRYQRARSVAPLTLPSHASMLTGLYPPRHTVRDNAWRPLPASARTLAERAQEAGYQTAAFLSAVVLAAPYGLNQGFEVYGEPAQKNAVATAHMSERTAEETTAQALGWLRQRDPERPFFLWVHYFDPHAPYEPPQRFHQQAGGNAYLGEVSRMDAAIGKLIEALRNEDLLDQSVVAVVADHGEALGRHGEPTHSVLCYEEVLRVPFFVRHPDQARVGDSQAAVSVVDVFATFIEGLQLGPVGPVDGLSLYREDPPEDRAVYFESYAGYLNYGWSPLSGWADKNTKFLQGTRPEFFDLESDPGETLNRFSEADLSARQARLAELLQGEALNADKAEGAGVGRELVEGARALGYAAAADPTASVPDPLASTGLPDARDRMDELARFYEATLLRNNGKRAEAIALMRSITSENPNNVYAKNVLATFLLEEGLFSEAAGELLSLPLDRQERLNVQDVLGHALEGLGQHDKALEHFERALAMKRGDPHQEGDVARLRAKTSKR